jgi:hypothetical protein
VFEGLVSKVVEPLGLNVSFELLVPRRPVVFQEPSTTPRKFRGGKCLDLVLDFLDLTHHPSTGASAYPRQTGCRAYLVAGQDYGEAVLGAWPGPVSGAIVPEG